jgi:UDP-GlcNAc:undecaprenyl-phosphate GlcNAc-1-phosphate transferase
LWRIAPGIVPIILLGLVDDTRSLKVFHKLLVQIIAGLLLVTAGFRLFVGIPLIDQVGLLSILLTVVYFVGISSAVNLVDGHDGLAGGICFIASAAFAVISSMAGAHANVAMSVALGAACLAFLVYNLPPGKIFMGDTGSMFLGITLGIVACSLTMFQPSVGTFFGVCFVLGVPILDTWLAIARRCALHKPIFKADALHMHHMLSSFGFSPKQTLTILYSVEFVLAVLGILATRGFVLPIVIGCGFFIFVFVSFFRLMMVEGQREREAAAVLTEDSIPSLQSRAIASKSSR